MMSRVYILGLIFASGVSLANNFSIEQLPIGAEVTVPPTAKTVVPMGSRIKLTSTDNPQTIRILPIGNGAVFPAPIKLSIFDANQERVKYVEVTPNAPFLYSFKGLSTISIQPSLVKGGSDAAKGVRMEIESDKAVTVAR